MPDLSEQSESLAARVAEEFNAIRGEMPEGVVADLALNAPLPAGLPAGLVIRLAD